MPATFAKGLRRAAAPVAETGVLVLFERRLDEDPLPAASPPSGWRIREAGPADLAVVSDGSDPDRPLEALRERFRRGDLCFVAESGAGEVGHVRWVTLNPPFVPEARRRLELAPGDVYFYDGFTRSNARRMGLDGAVRCAIFQAMRSRGHRRALSYVRGDNPGGLRAAGRWQDEMGRVRYLRLGPRKTWLLGSETIGGARFSPETAIDDERERAERSEKWRRWFEGWLRQPLDRRSTGFSALPDEYFEAVAAFVGDALDLSPASDRVLDVGCASAGVTRRLASRCRHLTGLDFVPGLVAEASRAGIRSAEGEGARFLTGDGRMLPFPSARFDKVYCVGMIHTLPSVEDGERVIRELVRVCAPGGKVLVGALPDVSLRWRARAEIWRRGGVRQRLRLAASLLVPAPLKRALRRLLDREDDGELVSLVYDLEDLKRRLEGPDVHCDILPFPEDFWSRDFRTTRRNLVIRNGEVAGRQSPVPGS